MLKLDFNRIQAPLFEVIKEANDNILFGLRLMDEIKTLPGLNLDQLSKDFQASGIRIQVGQPIQDLNEQKRTFRTWLLKKGFEDLAKAFNLCAIEAYHLFQLYKLNGQTILLQELEEEIKRIKKDALSQNNFPSLLDDKLPTANMTYKEPVKSMNRVRNCLVHRNGVVTEEKDINDKANKVLRLSYYSLQTVRIDENGKETDRLENTGIGLMAKPKDKLFQIGERIELSESEFRGCLFTCQTFGIELTEVIKKNCP